jgi:GNAT superfamily N-acetyltransferase
MEFLPLVPGTPAFEGAVDCYWDIFGDAPAGRRSRETVGAVFRSHADFPGFEGLVAATGGSVRSPGSVLGYAYGYGSRPEQYYREVLADALPAAQADRWLADCFEFVELGVAPDYRRHGLGGRLHDALLENRPEATSVLTTGVDNEAARSLYVDRGWEAVLEPISVRGGPRMVVMAREL